MGTLLSGIAAWSFLTSFPFPKKWVETSEPFFKKSPIWYFAVAVSLGIVWMLMSKGLLWIFPPSLSSFLLVLFMIYTTGGLHLDGLADTFDGLGSRREKERALEILSDSRIGVFGVLALIACIGLKWLAVSHLITETSEGLQCGVLLSLPIVGRFCMLLHWNGIPPARTSGLAHFFEKRFIFLGLLLSFVGGVSLVYGVLNWKGLAVMAFATTGMIVFSWICWKKFGGYTGDTLGATCEISETLWLVGFTMTLEGIG